ncbi:phosphopantetheine-containing protein [Chromatiales bacterium (ex Bugula neritina AB1)]|nr:phosphopantetheine-containing protein [Chromatiales bacterium (ex Bugula neritina AB1)]
MITEEAVRQFIQNELDIDDTSIAGSTPLFSSGMIDSFSLISLMSFIEDNGNIRVNPTEVTLENFDSIDKILAYIQQKT